MRACSARLACVALTTDRPSVVRQHTGHRNKHPQNILKGSTAHESIEPQRAILHLVTRRYLRNRYVCGRYGPADQIGSIASYGTHTDALGRDGRLDGAGVHDFRAQAALTDGRILDSCLSILALDTRQGITRPAAALPVLARAVTSNQTVRVLAAPYGPDPDRPSGTPSNTTCTTYLYGEVVYGTLQTLQ